MNDGPDLDRHCNNVATLEDGNWTLPLDETELLICEMVQWQAVYMDIAMRQYRSFEVTYEASPDDSRSNPMQAGHAFNHEFKRVRAPSRPPGQVE